VPRGLFYWRPAACDFSIDFYRILRYNLDVVSEWRRKMNLKSAAVVARTVSRLLGKRGFKMARVQRERRTEGLYVHRVGVSRSVSIGYHRECYLGVNKEMGEALRGARAFLRELGYPFGPEGWIECKGP
jgi:hypothetical protein